MTFKQALEIMKKYYDDSVFTLEQTEAFEIIFEKCLKISEKNK